MRTDRDPCSAAAEEVAERRQRGTDARVVGDVPVLERNVEVCPDEDVLTRYVRFAYGARPPHSSSIGID
jgi:hypothetical protein